MKKGNFKRIAQKLASVNEQSVSKTELLDRLKTLNFLIQNLEREEHLLSQTEREKAAHAIKKISEKELVNNIIMDHNLTVEDLVSRAPRLCHEMMWRGWLEKDTARRMTEYRVDLLV